MFPSHRRELLFFIRSSAVRIFCCHLTNQVRKVLFSHRFFLPNHAAMSQCLCCYGRIEHANIRPPSPLARQNVQENFKNVWSARLCPISLYKVCNMWMAPTPCYAELCNFPNFLYSSRKNICSCLCYVAMNCYAKMQWYVSLRQLTLDQLISTRVFCAHNLLGVWN